MTEKILDSVDFSYMDYPEESTGRVLGRRKQAVLLAERFCKENGEDYKDCSVSRKHRIYQSAYFAIILEESRRVFND